MKIQKTALASAVGAALAVSGVATSVAYADGHEVTLYGRVNNAYNMLDVDGDTINLETDEVEGFDSDPTNISTIGSRVGIRASAPIDADTTAHARFEWSASSDDETGAFGDTRIGEVGVTGTFGTGKVGNMWSTFYNVVGSHLDPTVTLGAVLYSTVADFPYRASNTIQYSNSFGAINLSAEIRVSDEDDSDEGGKGDAEKIGATDGHAIGVSFMPMEQLLLAVAVDSSSDGDLDDPDTEDFEEDVDRDRTGFVAKWSQDNWWASVGIAMHDADNVVEYTQTQIHAGMDFGNGLSAWVGIGTVETEFDSSLGIDGDPDDSEATTINVTKRIGNSGLRVYYEGIIASDIVTFDRAGAEAELYDQDQHLIGLRMDF